MDLFRLMHSLNHLLIEQYYNFDVQVIIKNFRVLQIK